MSPTLLIVPADSPYKTLADFIADAKAKPGQLAFSSGGLYGMSHLPAEIFVRAAGLKVRHVPYTGGGPSLTAVVGKQVDFSVNYPANTLPLVRGNKVKALAVIGGKRLKSAPNIPTTKELGIDAEYYGWVGLLAPVKTPKPIVDKLRDVMKKVVESKAFIDIIEQAGDEVYFLNGEELAKYMDDRVGENRQTLRRDGERSSQVGWVDVPIDPRLEFPSQQCVRGGVLVVRHPTPAGPLIGFVAQHHRRIVPFNDQS